jgi:Cu(I)/Ag(I) efflux system membrane fusion protein/cobalt-zinc-cadmium efflux system membrane fusion protein
MNMTKKTAIPLAVLVIAAIFAGGYFLGTHRHEGPAETAGGTAEKVQYTCGMHPFVIQDEPGLCPICGMKLTPLKPGTGGAAPAAAERKVKHWVSPMDPTYVREEPGKDYMGHDLVPVYEEGGAAGGITIDPVTAQNMGIRTAAVERRDLARTIRTVGLVTYEEPRIYSVTTKIDGWVERLYVDQTGKFVQKGAPLLDIYSPELVAAQQEYLLALDNSRKLGDSPFPEVAESSRRLLEAARTRLKYWDVSEKQIQALEQTRQVRKTLTLYSPFSGIVTEKKVFAGMAVMPGADLMQISDISRVWVNAQIYEYELPWLKAGLAAVAELPFGQEKSLRGKVGYVYPYVEPETRTVKARLEFANPGYELKPDMYANVRIEAEPVRQALAIPANAVLRSGKGETVFVALGEGRFEPRTVKTGVQDEEGMVQVLEGLKEGEQVVTSAQFMLDSESKLREAIQKMTAPKAEAPAAPAAGEKEKLEELFK